MKRWTPLAGVLTAGVLVFGSAAPASAAQTPNLRCQTVLSAKLYELTTYANYDDDVVAPGIRRWNYFRFMVHGGGYDRRSNNVNVRLLEGSRLVYEYESPDSLEFNRWYVARPSSPVYTKSWGPKGEHDHRTNDVLRVEAIFDHAGGPDPSCIVLKKM
jgi:hypothetical protein